MKLEQFNLPNEPASAMTGVSRRRFLGVAGSTAVGLGMLALVGCEENDRIDPDAIDLGSGDIGILNYAYALEQLEAAFYVQVANSFYSGATDLEKTLLTDIRDHEVAHREFFKNALGASAIPGLEVNFSAIDFTSRASVLGTAKAFEDLGVSAYNGAGKLITSPDYLLLAGKIVSVEARHAATIRDLLSFGTFADNTVVDMNGLDKSRTPDEVLDIAKDFLRSKLSAANLPTT
jgi:hypothetical protein